MASSTPLLEQYRRIKQQHEGALLLFRVGDFYEMFYKDAEVGAKALNLTLTSRPHGHGNRVPLAGVPAKSLDTYVARLVARGFRVAICEQLEPPSARKPVVRRKVVEVITPGTLIRPGLLEEKRSNYLMALSPAGDTCGMAFADVSTGEFLLAEVPLSSLGEEVQKIEPRELLIPETWPEDRRLPDGIEVTRIEDYYFTEDFAFDRLTSHFGVAGLEGFGVGELTQAICAAAAVLEYLERTQQSALPHITRLAPYRTTEHLLIDRISRRNLELVERIHPDRDAGEGTLLAVLDHTVTPAGGRMVRRWLMAPLVSPAAINLRLDAVEELAEPGAALGPLRDLLSTIGDIERVASRIALERANARDLVGLGSWLSKIPAVRAALAGWHGKDAPALKSERLTAIRDGIEDFSPLVGDIGRILVESPPLALNEGGLIAPGVNAELDELRDISHNAKGFIAELQERERKNTGIPNLRVGYNSVFGYYLEVTKSWLGQVPSDWLRKQTLASGERYITPELKEYETKVIHAEERIKTLEFDLFAALRRRVGQETERLIRLALLLAELDVLAGFAEAARERRYIRPVVDESGLLEIIRGRHPVVETMLERPFMPNDTRLDNDTEQIAIITGPNMAGKSTYLRQVALIAIMAQAGSFVPAARARVGVVDKVFTRIGASDDLARGVSTFLAEMTETANILNNATSRSLVILDEVGRGTATNDGLAIAWAAVEHLHGPENRRPRSLFATHYHELTDITVLLPRARNYNFAVRERTNGVTFLRKLNPGPAGKSYGIAVARLAGLPAEVISRARELLERFEAGEQRAVLGLLPGSEAGREPGEFTRVAESPAEPHPVVSHLLESDPDHLSPLEALTLLAELRRLAGDNRASPSSQSRY
ncbi:MAG TPA: DNA mismatch repair protein MutS [candidate division WOR-3 bacterium]|uniref:DNA mismatch repair protein MutS n=1 Tax=candidate division WOR-3 bacterium TaxID=2052148 RepID=A0A7V0T4F3_UNCW3|nr:DNA mismatch repair protein MutS [candidate division WOR-3 bacterium]